MKITKKALAVLKATGPDELMEHADVHDGFSVKCGEWTYGGWEPDAREYRCESCGSRSVYGAEQVVFLTL